MELSRDEKLVGDNYDIWHRKIQYLLNDKLFWNMSYNMRSLYIFMFVNNVLEYVLQYAIIKSQYFLVAMRDRN